MIELEVYAAGLRNIDKILELDHQLATVPGLRYKVDRSQDLVYLEMEEAGITLRELRAMFRKIGLEPRFIGAVPDELRAKSKTRPGASGSRRVENGAGAKMIARCLRAVCASV